MPNDPFVDVAALSSLGPIRYLDARDQATFDAGLIKVETFHLYSSKLLPSGSVHTRELTISAAGSR